jgi:hypothetical protein
MPLWIRSRWFVVFFYALVAIVYTWPLASVSLDQIPGGSNDVWQNLWNFWWWRYAIVELGQSPFSSDFLFFPHGASLTFHTHSIFNQIVAFPVNLIWGPVAAHNFAILLAITLSGVAAQHLALEVSDDFGASLIAGFIFAVFPHHLEQSLEHMNLTSMQFLPWVALYGLKIVRRSDLRNTLLFGLVFALNALSCWHYAIFTLFILPWLWGFEIWRAEDPAAQGLRFAKNAAIAGAVAAAIASPIVIPMLTEIATGEQYLKLPVNKGIDLAFLFLPSDHNPILGPLTEAFYRDHRAYPALGSLGYLGYSVLSLASLGLTRWRTAPLVAPFALITITSLVLSIGAEPTFAGRPIGFTGPHAVFQFIPGLEALRVANRFIVLTMLGLCILASIGVASRFPRSPKTVALCFASIAIEFAWAPYPVQPLRFSPILDELRLEADGAILDIPFTANNTTAINQAYQIQHERPIAGGYISVAPRGQADFARDSSLSRLAGLAPEQLPDEIDVAHLRDLGFSHVVLHLDRTRESLDREYRQLETSASFYRRRRFAHVPAMSRVTMEAISSRLEAALGAPSSEDESLRVFRLQ